jgi:hypothetical protein
MDVVSPLAESRRINRAEEEQASHIDEFKVVRKELNMLKKEIENFGDKEKVSEISSKEIKGAIGDDQHDIVCNACKERCSKDVVDKGINTNDENTPPSNDITSDPKESLELHNINLQKKIDELEEELIRTFQKNQSLEKELSQSKSQMLQMEKTTLKSKAQQDDLKDEYCNRIKELIQQNLHSQQHVKMAEADADMALKIAKDSDAKRYEMELALETVVKELELLKGCHVEEKSTSKSSSLKNESVWRTVVGKDSASIVDESDGSSSAFSLESLDTPHSPVNVLQNDQTSNTSKALNNDIKDSMVKVHNIVRTSGMYLKLPGKWFSKSSLSGTEVDMESISKSYCMLVENIIHQQWDELKELKEFCSYLEGKLVVE